MYTVHTTRDAGLSNAWQDSRRARSDTSCHDKKPTTFRALVVEVDAIIRESVAKILVSFGLEVSQAEDGITAMSHLAAGSFDVVITHFNMPVMNGYRMSKWIKKESPGTKVIIITAACQAEVHNFMAAGIVDQWLFKPFGGDELRETIQKLSLPLNSCGCE